MQNFYFELIDEIDLETGEDSNEPKMRESIGVITEFENIVTKNIKQLTENEESIQTRNSGGNRFI